MSKKLTAALAVILLAGAGAAYCEAPNLLTYQGRLKEAGGLANGNHTVQIILCSDPGGDSCYDTSPLSQIVNFSSGLFKVNYSVPSNIDLTTGVWYLELRVDGNVYLPREQLPSLPYAIYTATASALDAAPNTAGAYVSTNIYITGYSSATVYYGNGATLTNVSTQTLKIGDTYGGGKIFWIDSAGKQVLITALTNQSGGIEWATPPLTTIGATNDAVYAGKANTVMISTSLGAGSYAARLCEDYSTTVNGEYYDDWYLPSLTELNLQYQQLAAIADCGFTPQNYSWWSSTEFDAAGAYYLYFGNGSSGSISKTLTSNRVHCIRAGPTTAVGNLPRNAETVTGAAYVTSTQTFTGSNTFSDVATTTLTVTSAGTAALARILTQTGDTGFTVTSADLGKTITVNSGSPQTVTLPLVNGADVGATVTVVKLGAGKVTIVAPTGNCIYEVCDTAALYSDAASPVYASVTLQLADNIRWVVTGSAGSWVNQ